LAFQVGDTRYRYKACPFGLSPLPKLFTDVSEVLKVYVRKTWQIVAYQYIDEWLFLSGDRVKVGWVTRAFVRLCIKLGLIVNLKKSVLLPSRQLVHMGMLWDFENAKVRVPDEKIEKICHEATRFLKATSCQLPLAESLMGKLVSVEKVVPWGRLHFRMFQKQLLSELKWGRSFRMYRLNQGARDDLRWWADAHHLRIWTTARQRVPQVVVHTDASLHGWGATGDDWCLKGDWSFQTKIRFHINLLELQAVKNVLLLEPHRVAGKVVRFMIDNSSVVYYINKQGGTRSSSLAEATRQLLLLAESLDCELQAVHIKGELNVLADMLSRTSLVLKTEWRLSVKSFNWLCTVSAWGVPEVELFANRLNHHLPRFFSPCVDQEAEATDALVSKWPRATCYAFPPATILSRVASKIMEERPERLILVAPWWPGKSWFPILHANAVSVHLFPEESLELVQPHFDHKMQDPLSLCLAVWNISFLN
jgi:hypothetical protein